jgi:hypothetical protein
VPSDQKDTQNLLSLYMRYAGVSEVPASFQLWSAISVMAAAVRDTVWLNWFKDPTVPNLIIFLVGESGIGKEKAINAAVRFVTDLPVVHLYGGRATGPALIDELVDRPAKVNGRIVMSSPIYFVTEELNMSIRGGEQAQDLISVCTKLYGREPYPVKERTRTRGSTVTIPKPCLNWLAGSTQEWLMRSIPKDSIEGGFFARVLPVVGEKDYSVRHPRPIYPPDYEELKAIIAQRIKHLTEIEGEIQVSDEAWAWHDKWYTSRTTPEDRNMRPSFNRADEMLLKLAMLLCLAEWDSIGDPDGFEGVIQVRHMEGALELWESIAATLPVILRSSMTTYQTVLLDRVEEAMKRFRSIGHSDLAKRLVTKGLRGADVHRGIAELLDRGDVEIYYVGKAKAYRWIGG